MATYDYDLGILGGGAAGLTVAAGGAQFGAKVLLVEKTGRLGGECLHTGCVPSKTLIRTAGVWALARRTPEFGLPALELPEVDLGAVMARVRSVIEAIQEHDSPERFCRLGAEVRFGSARFVDDHTVDLDGRRISARAWVVATGSRPALPPVDGLSDTPHWTNETVFGQTRLPGRLLVLGGGPIGVELAQAFQRLGSRVTVVEFLDQILGPEDPDVAAILRQRLEAEGMEILTATRAVRAEPDGAGVRLTVAPSSGPGEARVLEADALLVATGRRPNVEDLGLEAAGVEVGPRGIPTDARLRTNVRHIYACGDVNGVFPFTHVAGYEASVALSNAILRLPRKADYAKVPWCTYTDPEVASVGLNEKRAREQGVKYRVLEASFADNDRALAEGEAAGKIKVLVSPKGKVLGCQIVGAHAGELIHEWVVAVAGGVRLATLAGAIHVYPTLSEISKRAAGAYFAEKLFSDRTKGVLRFLFQIKGRACTPDSPAPEP
ncbi:dihydrolipoyl dehydrogenase family protein [Deferrisoma camini]|uniref:dihydrolipoyl dehydrogenase family protein n=1 Tax=Deferrisoma camini TaxID=1035120 RepID=UPI00046CE7CD|nr:FAD-dependent oxidoreductase [Deferrisoma camini]